MTRVTLAVLVAFLGSTGAQAARLEKFQGAWGAAGIPCHKIFTRKDGKISFIDYRGEKATGFIADKGFVQGAQASCKLLSSKESNGVFKAVLGCREEIIFDKVTVSIRFVDDDNLVRFDPDFPELESRYQRCRM